MELKINNLGLAVFIKTMIDEKLEYAINTKLKEVKNKIFIYKSDMNENQWLVKYINHVCSKFDKNMMNMRKFFIET